MSVDYHAPAEAQVLWDEASKALRAYNAGPGMGDGHWVRELGVRPGGTPPDPMDGLVFAIACWMAMQAMRKCDSVMYTIADKDVFSPEREWHNERGTGLADILNLKVKDAVRVLERAKGCMYAQMEEDGCVGCRRQGAAD